MPEQTKIEPLSATEYDIIEKALWELVKRYPGYGENGDPDVIPKYGELDSGVSLAVFANGGRYTGHDIVGGFTAEVNFSVMYKSNPKNSPQRINSQAFVGRIMRWLENTNNLPLLTDGRTITKITASGTYDGGTTQDKSTIYAADAVMEYRKKGE